MKKESHAAMLVLLILTGSSAFSVNLGNVLGASSCLGPGCGAPGQLTPIPCGSNSQTTIPLNTTLTNGTGYAEFGPELGEYHLSLYALGNYFVDASTLPERTTCVTLSIPSGETVIEYSATFQFGC